MTLQSVASGTGKRLIYEYDFGDGWTHDILVEDVIDEPCERIRCIKGRRHCPPEDVGGQWGYEEFVEVMADPSHERHSELLEWYGGPFDPDEFAPDEVNLALSSDEP